MKSYPVGLHPGAVWRRVDFQVHTPRDPNWSGSPPLPGKSDADRDARIAWAKEFVRACRSKGLTAIAITDHHDMGMVSYVKRAIREEDLEDDLWLFPGMEVTCDDACQAIVLFDCATDDPTHWTRLYGAVLPGVRRPGHDDGRIPQARQCGNSIENLISCIKSDAVLEPVCIVLPHAGDDGAHKSVLRREFNVRFRELDCDGFYSDKPFAELRPRTKSIVFGEYAEWGTRRRGLIPTGDNRSADFKSLGKSPCWIRLGEPTAEAIRQALLVDEARITYAPPTLPSQRILEVRVSSSLTGPDLTVAFNDGFTAVIGGRGSGKSALLEYLRFALGRSALDIETDDGEHARAKKLLEDTLPGGVVIVRVDRDGVRETWTRHFDTLDTITVRSDDGIDEELDVAVAQDRFRARAFAQKELSTILDSRRSAMEQITSIAAAEFREKRHAAERAVEQTKRGLRDALLRLADLWRSRSELEAAQGRVRDLNRRLAALGKQLEEKGLSPADKQVLEEAAAYNRADAYLNEVATELSGSVAETERLVTDLLSEVSLPTLPDARDFDAIRRLHEEVLEARSTLQGQVREISRQLRALEESRGRAVDQFGDVLRAFRERHAAAAGQQSELRELVADQKRLQEELKEAEVAERSAVRSCKELEGAEKDLQEARQQLAAAVNGRRSVLEEARDAARRVSEGLLRAEVETPEVPQEYVDALSELGDGCRIHDLAPKAEDRAAELARVGDAAWQDLADRVTSLLQWKLENAVTDQVAVDDVRKILGEVFLSGLTERQLTELVRRLSEERVVGVLSATQEDFISFDYRDRDGYIRFENASPGQQAAALLQLLLSQEAGTLVIDQPEEDLDSGVVMEIVSLLRKTKHRRQVIFATHNANFVVNGDADKVVALKPSSRDRDERDEPDEDGARVRLLVDGALETAAVREAVARTMEGGRDAFELRRRKYRFPKPA